MKTAKHILGSFGQAAECADAVNALGKDFLPDDRSELTLFTVNMWRYRRRIPSDWYPALLEAGRIKGLDFDIDDLVNHVLSKEDETLAA